MLHAQDLRCVCRGHQIDLPVAQHLLHVLPAVLIADIFIIQIGVSAKELQKIEAVASSDRPALALEKLMVARKREIAHANGSRLRSKGKRQADCRKQRRQA